MASSTAYARSDAATVSTGSANQHKHSVSEGTEPLRFVQHSSFANAVTEQELWGAHQPEINIPPYSLLPEIEDGVVPTAHRRVLSIEEERLLFLRYNYAKCRLKRLLDRRRSKDTADRRAREELWRERARQAMEQILHANLPLVPSMAKRKTVIGVEFADMVSEGYMAMLRAIEHFDISRGFKFSTYACRAILACFHRMGTKSQTYRRHIPHRFDPEMEQSDFADRRHDSQHAVAIDAVRRAILSNDADLTDAERRILRHRFPMTAGRRPKTLCQLGREVGLSNERVRQIERRSLEKLRLIIEPCLAR